MLFLFICKLILLLSALGICKAGDFYSLSAKDIFGKHVDFTSFQGKVVLVVNLPFECRFTDSVYEDLQGLYTELSGLETFTILGFMSDQFGGLYPPCDEKQILKYKKKKLPFDFPIFKKVNVVDPGAHPVFKYLTKESQITPDGNFYKYLIDHHGKVSEVFPPHVSILDEAFETISKYAELTLEEAMSNMSKMIKEFDKEEKEAKRKKKISTEK